MMTIDDIRARVHDITERAKAYMKERQAQNKCCEADCDLPLAGAAFVFGDAYCVKHASTMELDVLIGDQQDDAVGNPW